MKRVYKKSDGHEPSQRDWGESLDDWLARNITHQAYDAAGYGSPDNCIETQIRRLATTLGKVIAILNSRGQITDKEVRDLVESNLSYRERDVEFREPSDD